MVHDRCWTAARRKRHNLQDDDSCTACLQLPETIPHILIECVFAREIWTILLRKWNWFRLAAQLAVHEEFIDWWQWSRKEMHRDDRKTFDTLVVLVAWLLWKERNNRGEGYGAKDSGRPRKSLGFCRLYTPPEAVPESC